MEEADMDDIARAIVADGKGILAADESTGTIKKRFDSIDVESVEDTRRAYREMLFTTEGAGEAISGVILYDETLRQSAADGTPFAKLLQNAGMIPGIKVDTGAKPLAGSPDEKVTEGLDGLRERCREYYQLGARFAKWRAVITIAGDAHPSQACISANAHALARYAALCQEAKLVPIVEPEVLMDGGHDIDRCAAVTEATLAEVYNQLRIQNVRLEATLLKPNMVLSGTDCATQADVNDVARRTVEVLKRTVPAAVPGIVFLSGGQSDLLATEHLNAMNALGETVPWKLSFSYGRALQAAPLKAWGGDPANVPAAQRAFLHRARANGAAALGTWSMEMEQAA
ncbi:MAG: fructose-bisphosphate aldolase class I [Alphaproteobacteria bacterium]|nr:fructose-bisphosphate aldolase class I [Alphaproteobacteria bacterium]